MLQTIKSEYTEQLQVLLQGRAQGKIQYVYVTATLLNIPVEN